MKNRVTKETNDYVKNNVFYIFKDDSLFIKLIGRFTVLNSIDFKKFIKNNFLEKDKTTNLYIDLSETEYLDSTFMGVIIYIYKKLNEDRNKVLKMINVSKAAIENLKSLGIDKILVFESNNEKLDRDKMKNFYCFNEQKNKVFKSILKSHILLSEINKNNKKEFCSLISSLRKEKNNH